MPHPEIVYLSKTAHKRDLVVADMSIYECFIRGENFRWKEDGVIKLMGFYTTR